MRTRWEDMPADMVQTLAELGQFGPTVFGNELKGYIDGSKEYLSAADLRRIARHLDMAADWLEQEDGCAGTTGK